MNEDRLRRQLRAQAAVNRQLHAQLAEVTAELRAVKGNEASAVRVLWRQAQSVLPAPIASPSASSSGAPTTGRPARGGSTAWPRRCTGAAASPRTRSSSATTRAGACAPPGSPA